MKTYNEFVRIERDSVRRRSKTDAGNNFTAEDLDIISQKNSSLKSISLAMEIKEMLSTNKYEFVEPNWIVRNFSTDWFEMGFQWGLRNIAVGTFPFFGGTIGIDVQAEKAWEIVGQNEGPIVAVVDTGVQYLHPDLKDSMWINTGETGTDQNGLDKSSNNIDDDQNGYIDDVHGINTVKVFDEVDQVLRNKFKEGDPTERNEDSHGTHVAGIVAANGSGRGLAYNSKIMALGCFDYDGTGELSDILECIDYAISNGAKIINASYGSYANNSAQRTAEVEIIQKAADRGIVFVAAAGNEGLSNDFTHSFQNDQGELITGRVYPASHDIENIISVASIDSRGLLVENSNFGSATVDLAAPGYSIWSTQKDYGYTAMSGTSMATPFVSAAAALLLTMEPDLTPAEVRQRIISNVTPLESLNGKTVSGGMLNAHHVLAPPPAVPMVLDVTYSPQIPETGKPMDLVVQVTGPDPILGATVTATMGKLEQYSLFDNGGGIDKLAGDGIYSIQAYAPELASFDLNISVTAPDRDPVEKVFTISTITVPGMTTLSMPYHWTHPLPAPPGQISMPPRRRVSPSSNPPFPRLFGTPGNPHRRVMPGFQLLAVLLTPPLQFIREQSLALFNSLLPTTMPAMNNSGPKWSSPRKKMHSIIYRLVANWVGVGEIVINHPQPEEPEPEILPPVILTEFVRATRVAGEEYSIEAEVAGSEPFSFRWFKDGRVLPQSKQQNLYLTDLEVSNSGRYSLQVSNEADVTNARMLDLVVEPKLEIRLQASILPRLPERLKTFSIEVRAQTDIGALLGATLEASIDESTPLSLLDDGTSPDQVAGDGVYSASATAPDAPSFVLSVSASASGTEPARIVRTFETIQRPPNDSFTGAILLDNKKHITQTDNSLATTEQNEPLFVDELTNTLWYRWEPDTEGTARISTKGSSPDTTLAIFTGTSIDALSQVASNDNFQPQARHAEVVFKAISGTSYLIQVGSKSGNGGKIRLHHPAPKKDEPKLIPPRIVTRPSELSKTEGEHLSISVHATGSAPLSYQWYVNNRVIPGARRSSYMIKQLSIRDSGIYSVRVSNKAGRTNAPLYNVTVRPSRETAPNDMVENAQPIAGSRAKFSTITRNATGQLREPNHAGVSTPLHSVWWTWKASKNGQVKLSTAGSSFDTTLSAYRLLDDSETDNRRADDPGRQISSFTAPTRGNDLSVTLPGHGFAIGQVVEINGVVGHSSESAKFLISSVKGDTFFLSGTANMDGLSLTPESRAKIIK